MQTGECERGTGRKRNGKKDAHRPFQASVQKAREEKKEESLEVQNGNTEQLLTVHMWTEKPLYRSFILFYEDFYSTFVHVGD